MKSPYFVVSLMALSAGVVPAASPASSLGGVPGERSVAYLSAQKRTTAQAAIERVWYNHRTWPKGNPQPKPPFEAMVSGSVIAAKVGDALRKSAALERIWGVFLTPQMLQEETERMKRDSKAPEILAELFAALDDDPRLIDEVLSRGLLADRLIRRLYASDARFHRDAAELARRLARGDADWSGDAGARYREILTVSEPSRQKDDLALPRILTTRINPTTYLEMRRQAKPGGMLGIEEELEGFLVRRVITVRTSSIETETIRVRKTPFDEWWENGAKLPKGASEQDFPDDLVIEARRSIQSAVCDQWENPTGFASVGVPAARAIHTAVWTGAEMIIWGGGNYLNSGGRYNPATDAWTATSQGANVPAGRGEYTAVWSGSVMIIWGGEYYLGGGNFAYLNTGGYYDPVSDTWQPTPVNATTPEGRHRHTAIWTGGEMIVWGGRKGVRINTGGRLMPGAANWTPTTLLGAPVARYEHSVVWTGAEMIIWGGRDSNTPMFDTGGAYSPASDQWRATSTVGVPVARVFHTAVWTGEEMVIWGGANVTGSLNDGGRYNPSTDRWRSMTIASALGGRIEHSVVWTGDEMVIWGGSAQCSPTCIGFNDGGRYRPASDSWLPVSQGSGVPSIRHDHTAVWTGNQMIIWGGFDAGGYANTGGIYSSGSVASPANTLYVAKPSYIGLNWQTVYGAGSYNVKRVDLATALFPYTPNTIVSTPTIPQYSEPNDGQSHFYAVEAVNQCGATP